MSTSPLAPRRRIQNFDNFDSWKSPVSSRLQTTDSSLEDHKDRKPMLCDRQQGQGSGGTVTGRTLPMSWLRRVESTWSETYQPPCGERLSTTNSNLPVGVTMQLPVAERRASGMPTITHLTLPCARLDLARAKAGTAVFRYFQETRSRL